jgi:AraC-like DNA-binding protein
VEKAKELLATTQQRVKDVALACGFESIPYFNRVFKHRTGQQPSAYRTTHALGAGI